MEDGRPMEVEPISQGADSHESHRDLHSFSLDSHDTEPYTFYSPQPSDTSHNRAYAGQSYHPNHRQLWHPQMNDRSFDRSTSRMNRGPPWVPRRGFHDSGFGHHRFPHGSSRLPRHFPPPAHHQMPNRSRRDDTVPFAPKYPPEISISQDEHHRDESKFRTYVPSPQVDNSIPPSPAPYTSPAATADSRSDAQDNLPPLSLDEDGDAADKQKREQILKAVSAIDARIGEKIRSKEGLECELQIHQKDLDAYRRSVSSPASQWMIQSLPLLKKIYKENEEKRNESLKPLQKLMPALSQPQPPMTAPPMLPELRRSIMNDVMRKRYTQYVRLQSLQERYQTQRDKWSERLEKTKRRTLGSNFTITMDFWEPQGTTDRDRWASNLANLPMMVQTSGESEKFLNDNGLVEEAHEAQIERSLINPWTEEEIRIFIQRFLMYPKNFVKIATYLENKTTADVIEFYFRQKHRLRLRELLRTHQLQKRGGNGWKSRLPMTHTKKGGVSIMAGAKVSATEDGAEATYEVQTPGDEQTAEETTRWNEAEKDLLLEAMTRFGRDWKECANMVKSKTAAQCKNFFHNFKRKVNFDEALDRHSQLQQKAMGGARITRSSAKDVDESAATEGTPEDMGGDRSQGVSIDTGDDTESIHGASSEGGFRLSHWTEDEKDTFVALYQQKGRDWKGIAAEMGSKTPNQVRNFYQNYKSKLNIPQSSAPPSRPAKERDREREKERRAAKRRKPEDGVTDGDVASKKAKPEDDTGAQLDSQEKSSAIHRPPPGLVVGTPFSMSEHHPLTGFSGQFTHGLALPALNFSNLDASHFRKSGLFPRNPLVSTPAVAREEGAEEPETHQTHLPNIQNFFDSPFIRHIMSAPLPDTPPATVQFNRRMQLITKNLLPRPSPVSAAPPTVPSSSAPQLPAPESLLFVPPTQIPPAQIPPILIPFPSIPAPEAPAAEVPPKVGQQDESFNSNGQPFSIHQDVNTLSTAPIAAVNESSTSLSCEPFVHRHPLIAIPAADDSTQGPLISDPASSAQAVAAEGGGSNAN